MLLEIVSVSFAALCFGAPFPNLDRPIEPIYTAIVSYFHLFRLEVLIFAAIDIFIFSNVVTEYGSTTCENFHSI